MRKKQTFTLLAAAAIAAFAACSRTDNADLYADVTFNLQTETLNTKALELTDGVSDGLSATSLVYKTFDKDMNVVASLSGTATFSARQTTVTLRLLKGQKYSFLFLATAPGQEAYTLSADSKTLTVDYTKVLSNSEAADMFYTTDKIDFVSGPVEKTEILTRPLAQINLGAVTGDIAAAVTAGVVQNTITTAASFSTQLPSELDLFAGTVSENKVVSIPAANLLDVTLAKKLYVDGTSYDYVNYVYVLAGAKTNVDLSYTVNATLGQGTFTPNVITVTNVPIQRNYRTNILGNIFTAGAEFTIKIDQNYTDEHPAVNI